MGKKYIIELLDDCPSEFKGIIVFGLTPEGQISAEPIPVEDLTPYTEPDLDAIRNEAYDKAFEDAEQVAESGKRAMYQKGLKDAWEAVRKIYDISQEDRLEIFPEASTFVVADICDRYSASECIEKIRQYEQKQEEIKVGDEVERILNGEVDSKAVFLEDDEGYYCCLFWTGCCFTILSYPKEQFRKTGRHFDEIATILEKMRGEQDE